MLTKLNPAGSGPTFSTLLGGSSADGGSFIALDAVGAAYIVGSTGSANFPTTPGAFDTSFNGADDAFVSKISFGPGAPANLALTPKAASNVVGTQHCVTATVQDVMGNPTPGITVRFAVTGSVTTTGSQNTDANGQATFCYQGPALPGSDSIKAFADTNGNTSRDVGEPSDTASKVWTLPTSNCRVIVTGGGKITAANADRSDFSGNAHSDGAGNLKGQEEYQDHGPASAQNVKAIEIQAVTCDATRTRSTIFGTASINGSGTHEFRIDVQDVGEPGIGRDTYRILLDTGYDSGVQKLTGGNIQIH